MLDSNTAFPATWVKQPGQQESSHYEVSWTEPSGARFRRRFPFDRKYGEALKAAKDLIDSLDGTDVTLHRVSKYKMAI